MHDDFENEIRDLLATGDKISAIKRYREETGAGLVEAKSAVEALEAGHSFSASDQPDDAEFSRQFVELLGRGQKIEAVKLYRDRFRVGLKEAKDAVERIADENGIRTSSGGCLGVLLCGVMFFALVVPVLLCVSYD